MRLEIEAARLEGEKRLYTWKVSQRHSQGAGGRAQRSRSPWRRAWVPGPALVAAEPALGSLSQPLLALSSRRVQSLRRHCRCSRVSVR